MARTRLQTSRSRTRAGSGSGALDRLATQLAAFFARLNDPADFTAQIATAAVLLLAEAVLCLVIIRRVPYTEIDWVAYMQEVTGYLEGERDYAQLRGDTGPLVYPAGFVYLFAWLKRVTGGSVVAAQYIFAGLYLASQAVVMALYIRTARLPPWSLALLCASRRLHSIHVLRLFNDCWAMAGAYLATLALQSRRWVWAVLLYSLAVSVKMNVLLMAPGVLAVLIKHARPPAVLAGTALGVALQLGLGAPFLMAHPRSYLARAFEFSRVFTYKWSVNWQFLPEPAFLSHQLALGLVALHLRLLYSMAQKHWFRQEGGILPVLHTFFSQTTNATSRNPDSTTPAEPESEVAVRQEPGSSGRRGGSSSKNSGRSGIKGGSSGGVYEDEVLFLVFSSNLAGIFASRTIHYQFYSWYYHTLPLLLLTGPLPRWLALAVLAGIEVVYNIYPPRAWASLLLLALHAAVMGSVLHHRGWRGARGGSTAAAAVVRKAGK